MAAPAKVKQRNSTQLVAEGFAALVEKLGMADGVRFVQLHDQREGDYTKERHQWLVRLDTRRLDDSWPRRARKGRQLELELPHEVTSAAGSARDGLSIGGRGTSA